jgi:hypothetical protein
MAANGRRSGQHTVRVRPGAQAAGPRGMGEAGRAFDTATNRVAAVKVFPANLVNDPQFEQRFRREALAVAGWRTPYDVPTTPSATSTAASKSRWSAQPAPRAPMPHCTARLQSLA